MFDGMKVVLFDAKMLTWLITMGLLDTSCCRGSFAGSLGCKVLTWGFATSGFTCSKSRWLVILYCVDVLMMLDDGKVLDVMMDGHDATWR